MNWKLIFQLSLFGLAMGIATVFVPFFWLAIFIMCAYIIVRQVLSRHFVHGLYGQHREQTSTSRTMRRRRR